jgi:hypothetical protein
VEPVTLPYRMKAGAAVGSANGGGTLIIDQGALVLEPGPLTRRQSGVERVVHDRHEVTMIKSCLLPPNMNTYLVLEADDRVVVAAVPGWQRARIRVLLADAGFSLREERRWISMAQEVLRPWP